MLVLTVNYDIECYSLTVRKVGTSGRSYTGASVADFRAGSHMINGTS